eukprot:TRINITY_DN27548_c0_g2_i1.p1 TRINITY_DN27548_c0_g2~~TRINITY_DN27548_c0_g2_i1.p1  ORF type:complete len:4734 (-),score=1179.49 TRINITY_DN27548_c0_g2_i1:215-14152(-)
MSASIAAARISYALGLKGPAYIVDTACSSALVALDCAATALRKGRCSAAVNAAANVMASPSTYISFSKPRMLSEKGRCFTFDASADGYARGEGAGVVVLRKAEEAAASGASEACPVGTLERCALRGVAVNQDGRSSTLTAPNGPSQQLVMTVALTEARMQPQEVVHMECHGTGTPLGDPIEVGALKTLNTGRSADLPLVLAAVKSNDGHLEGAAASTGLLKSVALLEHAASTSSLHLRSLNPNVAALEDLPSAFVTESLCLSKLAKASSLGKGELCKVGGGLSSFGFGGTNAHGVVSAATEAGEACRAAAAGGAVVRPAAAVFSRRSLPWREVGYRFLRANPSEGVFEVAMRMDVYDVVKHHVVFGSIVVPGVVYVEMALEATKQLFGYGVRLTDISMVFPFVIPVRETGAEPAAVMRFVQKSETRFQIESTSATGSVTVHAEGGFNRSAPKGEEAEVDAAAKAGPVDLEALKARVIEVVPTKDVYAAIDGVGLYLGPMFQVAKQLWRKEPDEGSESSIIEVLGRLQLDDGVPNVGYVLHPAVFDGTIHTLGTASVGKNVNDLKIFGGVGRVSVIAQENFSLNEEYWIHLSIKEKLEASETFDLKVMSSNGNVLMLMDNVVFRKVLPEQIQMAIAAQSTPEDDQKVYEVEWQEVSHQADEEEASAEKERWLVLLGRATDSFKSELRAKLGDGHTYASLENETDWGKLNEFSKIVNLAGIEAMPAAADEAAGRVMDVLDGTLRLMQSMAKTASEESTESMPELWLLTRLSQAVVEDDLKASSSPLPASHAGLWGLAKAFRNEHPELPTAVTFDVQDSTCSNAADLVEQLQLLHRSRASGSQETELAVRKTDEDAKLWMPRLADCTQRLQQAREGSEPPTFSPDGMYVVTGGTGALGLLFVDWMVRCGARHFALLSRSGQPPADSRTAFRNLEKQLGKMDQATFSARKCNIGSGADVRRVLAELRSEKHDVRGFVHAAGTLADGLIKDGQNRESLQAVCSAKVDGSLYLHAAASELNLPLELFWLFSSVAAMVGSVAQGNYCAANAFMDAFGSLRRARDLPALSLQWGPWADVGMAARAGTSEGSIGRIELSRGLEAMELVLGARAALKPAGVLGVARIKWKSLLGQMPKVPPALSKFGGASGSKKKGAAAAGAVISADDIKGIVVGVLQDVLDGAGGDIDLSTPLMEMGLDSLAGVEFRNRLQASFEGLQLSSTLMFDYPTVPDLVDFIYSEVGPAEEDLAGAGAGALLGDSGAMLAVASHAGRYPGCLTNSVEEYWHNMSLGFDTTTELPPERWDMDAYFDPDVDAPGKTYVKLGHFIPGIDQFDGDFFGVSEAELRSMDPHQWLALEISYEAFHMAGLDKDSLQGLDCGVYVGCCNLGGNDVDPTALGPFSNIGAAYSGLSGRISHVLSLRGPCFTVDTACSSTIVALDSSCQALKLGRCRSAVATGANVQLSGAIWVGFSKMRGLAFDGRCKTFDSRADGFARGEGIGAAYIRSAGASDSVPDLAGLTGVATNHDGRAATITAPNGTAQQRVLRAALGERGTQAEDVTCLECHGTGTALGDPIEVGAQKAVYGKGRTEAQPLILAATKSNIGHLEGSAGVAGIAKVILAINHAQITPNLHLEKLNPNIDLNGFSVLMPDKLVDWKSASLRSGVSSFGFSGTNGHGLLEAIDSAADAQIQARKPLQFARKTLKPWREWMQTVLYLEEWAKSELVPSATLDGQVVFSTEGALSEELAKTLPTGLPLAAEAKSSSAIAQVMKTSAAPTAVFARGLEKGREDPLPGSVLEELLAFLQAAQAAEVPKMLLIVTRAAHDAKRPRFDAGASLWGLVRSARIEMPRFTIKSLDLALEASPQDIAKTIADELRSPAGDLEVAYTAEGRCVPRLIEAPQSTATSLQRQDAMRDAESAADVRAGLQLVTGGLGGLGLVAAEELAVLGAPGLLLTSRSGRIAEGQKVLEEKLRWLQALPGLKVQLKICNAADAKDVGKLIQESQDDPVRGVVHAAGVLDRCPLPELNKERLDKVLGAKACGAWHLHSSCSESPLFVLFSSVSATVGLAGGGSYAAANAYLDSLAAWRREGGRPGGVSLKWGPVSEVGMTAAAGSDTHLEGMALKTLSPAQVGSALRLCLAAPTPRAELTLARVDWPAFMREVGMDIPQLMDLKSKDTGAAVGGVASSGNALASLPIEERRGEVLKSIREAASGMGLEMDDNTPLMEAGIDSLSAVEFRNKVSSEFRSVKLPSTLMFDYPTLTALADYVSSQLVPDTGAVAPTAAVAALSLSTGGGNEPIAVLGGSCHLPGDSWTLANFDYMLSQGVDCSVEMPFNRWDVDDYYDPEASTGLKMYVRHAAFIEGVELFAANAFNINKAEAETMDPQQRHLLEAAFEAFSAAGLSKSALMGSLGGVFVGQDKCDWNRMITGAQSGPYAATGGSSSISANRINYVLGLKGPSATMDTACSSSLVAADTAAVTLRRRRCDVAVVCGVNMLLLPQTFVACCQAQMLSRGGRCRTFDESASGYARGEGVGAQALERLGGSKAPGTKTMLAELRGSALNQDGRSSNLTSPNGPSQQAVVLAALAEAQVQPARHVCVETHGTGTALGDPIEVGALQAALSGTRQYPLQLGAAKTNVGHLEGGAGMVGLTKLASLLGRNCLPANLHIRELNEHIADDLDDFAVNFPSEGCASDSIASASVSSFGFGGTNGHVLLARASTPASDGRGKKRLSQASTSMPPKRTAFLFTGQGSQYVGMGRQLYESEAVFRDAVDRCAKVLDSLLPTPLLEVMYGEEDKGLLDQTQFSQPAIFTIEYALAELWRSRGVEPCAVLGHSVGEYAAAVVAGVLDLEDALCLIAARGRLIAERCEADVGTMAAVFAPEKAVKEAMQKAKASEEDVAVAAVNGPKMTVISGRKAIIDKVVEAAGVTSRQLTVSHAFHSPLMAPMLDPFRQELDKAKSFGKSSPKMPFFSTLLGKEVQGDELAKASYWVEHVKCAVRFVDGMEALEAATEPAAFLEIGAAPTLVGMARRFVSRKSAIWVPSLDQKALPDEKEAIKKAADAIGAGTAGATAAAAGTAPASAQLERQAYPWREASHPLLKRRSTRADGATVFGCVFGGHVLELLSHHIVHGEVVVPGACYLEMIIAGCTAFVGNADAWCVENLGFAKPLVLRLLPDGQLEEVTELRLVLYPDGRLEVESEIGSDPEDSIVSVHVEATLVRKTGGWNKANRPEQDAFDLDKLRADCEEPVDIDLMYSFGRKSGLPLQRRFRTVRHVQKGDRRSFARLEMEKDGTQVGFWLGPSLIDGSFQASMALADAAVGIGTLKIPLGIRRLVPCGRPYSIAVWSYFELIDFTDRSTVFRSWLLNDAGEALLYFDHVHLQEVRDEHIQKVLAASGRQGLEQQALYDVSWRTLQEAVPASAGGARYLVLGSSAALTRLGAQSDKRCHCAALELGKEDDTSKLLTSEAWAAVILADGLSSSSAWAAKAAAAAKPGGEESDVAVLERAMFLTKVAAKLGAKAPHLVLPTWGSQPLASEDVEQRRQGAPDHSGLWGFARAVRMEYPGSLRVACVDLDASKDFKDAWSQLATDILPGLPTIGEDEVALRKKELQAARLVRSALKFKGATRLNMPARGSLTGLREVPQAETSMRVGTAPGMAQLRIRAVGLNFRDVLNVMGLYPGDPGPPGADCGGTVVGLGDNVEHLSLAEDVFGESPGCLSTYNTSSAALLTQKPPSWSFEEACCMPVIFATTEEALCDLAQLKKGERILIHAAAGGVGLVAIQYAQFVGAEVYATAGAEEKHNFLRGLGVKHITSSRNGAKFEEDMKQFLKEAGADGIDVVLNSLSHDDYIPRSLALLRKGGRFVEIGKRGIWTHEQMWQARPDVMYEKIASDTMMEKEPWRYNGYLKRLLTRVDNNGLKPINMHIFEGLSKGVSALQFLQRASNIGKVVISAPSRLLCKPDAMPLLSGGLGALGVVTAQFLVEEGAKTLCLLSRNGQPAKDVGPQWDWLQKSVADIRIEKCDVGREESVVALRDALKGGVPLGGLLHLAGVLADGVLPTLTRESLDRSYGPKVHGLFNLLQVLGFDAKAPHLFFSSTSALFGSPGQANYSASNSVLDSLAPFFSAQDAASTTVPWRNARSVQWGPWAEVGMAVQANTLGRAKSMGVGALTNAQGIAIMSSILSSSTMVVGAVPVRWGKYLKSAYVQTPTFLQDFEAEAKKEAAEARAARGERSSGEGGGGVLGALAGLSAEERLSAVRTSLRDMAREVVDSADLESDAALMESGMDSLSGVEFRNRLSAEFEGVHLPNSLVFDHPTITELAAFINGQLGDIPEASSASAVEASSSQPVTPERFVEQLNDRCAQGQVEQASSKPLFLVPGAGMQAGGFRGLAALLPLPTYGLTWPKGALPRSEWPSSLKELAERFFEEVQKVQPEGPYLLAGHSFGASVCLEMASVAASKGSHVSLVAMLDPRSLLPLDVDVQAAFAATGLADSLALLAQTVPAAEGKRYAELLEAVSAVEEKGRDDAVRKALSPGALSSLEHVHETTQWYSALLQSGSAPSPAKGTQVAILRAGMAWKATARDGESVAEKMVREFQAATFQEDTTVSKRVAASSSSALPAMRIPGTHFSMLHEPHVTKVALRLCSALSAADEDEEQ